MNKLNIMNLRAASLFVAFAFAALPTQAQGPTLQSLASDLAALTARVAKLEGQIVAADLVGTYAIHGIQNEMSAPGSPGGSTQISSYVFLGTVALAADGTGSLNGTESGNTLFLGPQSSVQPFQGSDSPPPTIDWTYADGTVTALGGSLSLSVTAGGRVLVGAGANHTDGTNVLLIFTRLQ
jgi:hypothetical protein